MNNSISANSCFFTLTLTFLTDYLLKQLNRSQNTVNSYRFALNEFFNFIAVEKKIDPYKFAFADCTHNFVLEYIQYLRESKNYAPSSVNQRLAALKSYFRFVADGHVDLMQLSFSVQNIPLLRVPKLQRPILEAEAIGWILQKPGKTVKGNRDRVMLILLYDSAVRVSELVGLEVGDVHLDVSDPYIVVTGKGRKQRSISLNHKDAEHLRLYMEHYHVHRPDPTTPLFYTVIHGEIRKMTTRNVQRIVKKYADEVREEHPEIPESVYPHMFRRSRATGLYRDEVPLELVSVALGHANIETTRVYALPSVEQLRTAMNKGQHAWGAMEGVERGKPAEKLWLNNLDEMRRKFGLV